VIAYIFIILLQSPIDYPFMRRAKKTMAVEGEWEISQTAKITVWLIKLIVSTHPAADQSVIRPDGDALSSIYG